MILRRLILPLALLLTAGVASPAHAGWLRTNKQQLRARQVKQKKDTDELHNRINSKSREQAERWARQQRQKATVKTYSSQVPSSNYKLVRVAPRVIVNIATKLGGSKRGNFASRRQQSGSGPVFGWKIIAAHNATTPNTGSPTIFAWNR